ncbi:MAG: hypothetical protein IPM12_15465 [Flavobacteriales bacterium]|nr:hypothetical protein [Flavobacteriales bacterium]
MWQRRLGHALSLGLGVLFIGGGMSKVFAQHAFPGVMGPVWLEEELAEYGLGTYAVFIAYSEAVIGFLLFTLLLRTLGAVMLVPMLVNMIAVTISLHWRGTPYVLGFFFLMNLALLYLDRARFAPLLGRPFPAAHPVRTPHLLLWCGGLVLFCISARASFVSVALGYALALAGIGLGFLAYYRHQRS